MESERLGRRESYGRIPLRKVLQPLCCVHARAEPTLDRSPAPQTAQICPPSTGLALLPLVAGGDASEGDMKKKQPGKSREAKAATSRHEHEAEAGLAGALAGAAMGGIGGPPGAAAGAVIGGIVGAMAAGVAEKNSAYRAMIDRELDAEIGVSRGDVGAPNVKHPPPKAGLYSSASSGAGLSGDSAPAEGPMQTPES